MDQNYMQIAIEGAFRLDPGVRTLDELRARTDAVMLRHGTPTLPTTPVVSLLDESAEDDGVVISRELAKEILTALHNAAGFAAFVSRRIADNGVADYAGSVRRDSIQAEMRFRRVCLAQEVA